MVRDVSGNAREQVLDAYVALLLEEGERAATVQAVAARAGVSKGGLLYHFASKADLEAGLIERLRRLGAADIEALRMSDDIVAAYLRTSIDQGSPLDRAIVALLRIAQSPTGHAARAALLQQDDAYARALAERLGDEELARTIVLLSDGVYLRSALGAQEPSQIATQIELLVRVARRLGA